jgi:hypothetical protein
MIADESVTIKMYNLKFEELWCYNYKSDGTLFLCVNHNSIMSFSEVNDDFVRLDFNGKCIEEQRTFKSKPSVQEPLIYVNERCMFWCVEQHTIKSYNMALDETEEVLHSDVRIRAIDMNPSRTALVAISNDVVVLTMPLAILPIKRASFVDVLIVVINGCG